MTPDGARELGVIAAAHARDRLLQRGIDPAACRPLLDALQHGTQQAIAAREHGRDTSDYRRYLDDVYARLDAADPPRLVDDLPEPPRARIAMRW